MRAYSLGPLVAGLLLSTMPAFADSTVTVTMSSTACKVDPPAEVAAPVTPSPEAGMAAVKSNNFALARANYRPLAEGGNAEAQRLYGALLMRDCTGIQDKTAGAGWLAKAADAGDVEAEAALAKAYMQGDGVAQDDNKAFALLSKAAGAGFHPAEVDLGYLYLSGRGGTKDLYQGMVWSVKAGEAGLPAALFNIARGYFTGNALPQDLHKAAYYMFVAIERSTGPQRARFTANINNISRELSADDLKHQAERARRWSPGPRSLSDVLDDAKERRDKKS